jgi:hypothetical protein
MRQRMQDGEVRPGSERGDGQAMTIALIRRAGHVLAAVSLLLATAGAARADAIAVGDTLTFADGPGTTGGGEFLVTVNSIESFITFCLQRTEFVNFATTFTIGGISEYASSDAPAQGGDAFGHDPLSAQTAWLYTAFRAGTLADYSYLGGNRPASADALQKAIWWFEGELGANPGNSFVDAANAAVLNGWSGLGQVRVLNLYTSAGAEAQDQLALIDPPGVPEPGSLALVGLGLGAAALRRRRRGRSLHGA